MRRALIILGTIAAIPVLLAVLLLGRGIVLQLMGYPVDIPPSELADEIAAENGDPLRCRRLKQTVPTMGPSLAEKRMLCFFLLAQKKKDPSICELLLPSEYGWDCLGTVASLIYTGYGCSSYASGEIYCSSGVRGRNTGIDDCGKYKEADLKYWCYVERTRTLEGVFDCDKIPADPPILRDECQRWYAYKLKDASLCSSIRDGKLRKVCELKVKYRGSGSSAL